MKQPSRFLNPAANNRGIAALGMAMITILVVSAISITLPRYLTQSSNATKDYRRQTRFQWILTQVGQIAYGAYQTGQRFPAPALCPAEATLLQVIDGQRYCFPNNGLCVSHPQLQNDVCIVPGDLTVQNSSSNNETQITLKVINTETFAQTSKRKFFDFSFAAYDIIDSSLNILPSAHAFDDTFGRPPIPPLAATINQVVVAVCPAGGAACLQCADAPANNTHCIRLRICDPHKQGGCIVDADYYYQRIAIYN